MRIVVWGINYWPEPTGIAPFNAGLCEWFAERGHAVEMVSTFAYYPAWKKNEADRGRLFRTDLRNGVTVRRCWHYVPARVTSLRRIFHEASFITTSFLRLLTLRRPDVLIVVSPPLPLGVPAWVISRLWRRPFVFHVQDLQPDAAVGLGMLKPGAFTKVLYALERFAYRKAARVSGISDGMLAAYRGKGLADEKIVFFPNWISDRDRPRPGAAEHAALRAEFCGRHELSPARRLLVYSGNIGMKQGLGVLLDAAAPAEGIPDAGGGQWVVAGDGAGKQVLIDEAARRGLATIKFLPLQPDARFNEMMLATDICVITQQKGTGQFFFPSKLLTALTYAKPILAVADADSELARAVVDGGFGVVAPPDDARAVATAAAQMSRAEDRQLAAWGENGLRWVNRFRRTAVLGEYEALLERLVQARAR